MTERRGKNLVRIDAAGDSGVPCVVYEGDIVEAWGGYGMGAEAKRPRGAYSQSRPRWLGPSR